MAQPVTGSAEIFWLLLSDAVMDLLYTMDDMSVGLQYFGQLDATGGGSTMCDISTYETADVDLADLAGNSEQIRQSLFQQATTTVPDGGSGEAPISVAIAGAVNRMKAWRADTGGLGAVLIVTGGDVSSPRCQFNATAAIDAARVGADQGIPTFVLGLGNGGGADTLARIAAAGDTKNVFFFGTPLEYLREAIGRFRFCSAANH